MAIFEKQKWNHTLAEFAYEWSMQCIMATPFLMSLHGSSVHPAFLSVDMNSFANATCEKRKQHEIFSAAFKTWQAPPRFKDKSMLMPPMEPSFRKHVW